MKSNTNMKSSTTVKGGVQRATVSKKAADEALHIFSEHARVESSQRREREAKRDQLLATAAAPLRALIQGDRKAMAAVKELQHLLEEKKHEFTRNYEEGLIRRFSDTMFDVQPRALPGATTFGPPYDYEWTQLLGTADRKAGTLAASALGSEERFESAAGLGVGMTSPATVNVRVSAYMPIHFDWSTLVIDGGWSRVDGQVRVIVFRDDGVIVADKSATLFDHLQSVNGAAEGHDDTYIGYTSAAHPQFQMEAGRIYYAWHYGIVGAVGHNTLAGAAVDCRIPFIVVAPV